MANSAKAPVLFWTIAGLALIWNLMGVGAYLFEAIASVEAINAAYSEYEAQAVFNRPSWLTGVFATAVFGGAIGCTGLLLRKKWALWALVISLLAVIIQQIHMWGFTVTASHMNGTSWIMPIMIPIIAIYLVWFAKQKIVEGILR